MYKDDIKEINAWFRKKSKESYGTYHHTVQVHGEELYSVAADDVEEFSDFLREHYPDLIGIPCMVGNVGIWFHREDLENSRSY